MAERNHTYPAIALYQVEEDTRHRHLNAGQHLAVNVSQYRMFRRPSAART